MHIDQKMFQYIIPLISLGDIIILLLGRWDMLGFHTFADIYINCISQKQRSYINNSTTLNWLNGCVWDWIRLSTDDRFTDVMETPPVLFCET